MFAPVSVAAGRAAFEDKQATEADFIAATGLCLELGADINAVNENGPDAVASGRGPSGPKASSRS